MIEPTITVTDGNGRNARTLTAAQYRELYESGMLWEFHPDAPLSWPYPSTPTMTSPLPDSGARSQYQTGAVRDASVGKGHFDSIPPIALRKLAKRFEDGSLKYLRANWMRGIPLSHYENSLTRHILAWKEGDTTEDHAGAIIWNACCMVWTDEEVKAGRLPAELDDLLFRPKAVQEREQQRRALKGKSKS